MAIKFIFNSSPEKSGEISSSTPMLYIKEHTITNLQVRMDSVAQDIAFVDSVLQDLVNHPNARTLKYLDISAKERGDCSDTDPNLLSVQKICAVLEGRGVTVSLNIPPAPSSALQPS